MSSTVVKKASKTMEQVIHQANLEWTIPSYQTWSKACPVGFIQSSGIFVFNFDDDDDKNNETYQFELQICPRFKEKNSPEGAQIYILNRNNFTVGIESSLIKPPELIGPGPKKAGCIKSGEAISFWLPFASEHAPFDLIIQCDIKILRNLTGLKEPARETRFQSFKRLLSDKTLADFVITCGKASFSCHRAILANKSPVFKSYFERHWKAGDAYKIDDFEPEVVGQMIYFIYNDELSETAKPSEALLRIGDKYDVNGLVALCSTEFAKHLNNDNAVRSLNLFFIAIDTTIK
jgi:hypothetical protein